MNMVESKTMIDVHALRQRRLDVGNMSLDRRGTVSGLAAGVGKMPMKTPSRPLNVTLTSSLSVPSSTVATSRETHDLVAARADRQRAEGFRRLQRRVGISMRTGDELALGRAGRGQKIASRRWRRDVVRGDVVRGHAHRIEPDRASRSLARRGSARRRRPGSSPGAAGSRASRYSVICSDLIALLANARYISANERPVPLVMIESSASVGSKLAHLLHLGR